MRYNGQCIQCIETRCLSPRGGHIHHQNFRRKWFSYSLEVTLREYKTYCWYLVQCIQTCHFTRTIIRQPIFPVNSTSHVLDASIHLAHQSEQLFLQPRISIHSVFPSISFTTHPNFPPFRLSYHIQLFKLVGLIVFPAFPCIRPFRPPSHSIYSIIPPPWSFGQPERSVYHVFPFN